MSPSAPARYRRGPGSWGGATTTTSWRSAAAAPDPPVMVVTGSGHMAVVNSLALRLAGITRDTPDPEGGHIVRDEHGEPTGLLQETAQELVRAVIPPPTVEDHVAALRRCND